MAMLIVVQEKYGGTRTYTSGTFVKGEGVTGGVEDTSDTRLVNASSSNPVTVTHTYYNYHFPSNYFENKSVYDVLLNGRHAFWLASRCVDLLQDYCYFLVGYAGFADLGYFSLIDSLCDANTVDCYVVPIVSLESDIPVDGKDTSGAWKLKIE